MNRTATAPINLASLALMAQKLRRHSVEMTTAAGSGHPTSALSCADIVSALFFHQMRWDPGDPHARDVDSFVLSKGHAAPILWAALWEAGAITEDLRSLRRIDSTLEGHPTPRNPWVRVATGSLGQGLAASNGMALANRLDGIDAHVYCLMGDGECSEGSVWEAAQFAQLHGLSSVVAIVDVNGLAQSGPAPYGHDTGVFATRFRAFGWNAIEIDGHDIAAIIDALEQGTQHGPTAIIARTVKGKGVSFLEARDDLHGKPLKPEQSAQALAELQGDDIRLRVAPQRLGARPRPSATGVSIACDYRPGQSMATREAFGHALRKLGDRHPRLVVLDGDVGNSTHTDLFAAAHPERFFQSSIAEQAMSGGALGLATGGFVPCAATFACFLSRAYDFIRMAGHSRPEHLIFCGSHAGVSIGEDGPSQMGLEDIAMFRALADSAVLYPCDAVSAEHLTACALDTPGIVYLRTTRGKTPVLYANDESFVVGGSKVLRRSAQDRVTLVAAGITVHEALAAAEALAVCGVAVRVIDAYSVRPLDEATLREAARETGLVITVEDHWRAGGLGEAVATLVCGEAAVHVLAVSDEPRSGKPDELLEFHGIGREAIARTVKALVD
jgi:transketolase